MSGWENASVEARYPVVTLTLNPALDDSYTVPRLKPTSKMRCSAPRFDPGGGGINVARVLAVMGERALAVFPVAGHLGEALLDLLRDEGVPVVGVPVAGETRQSHHVTDLETGLEYRFVLPGPALSAADRSRCLDVLTTAARRAGFVVVSGSLPPSVPPSFIAEVADAVEDVGARLVLDTSGDALRAVRHAYLIKPSVRELEELVGRPLHSYRDQVDGAQELRARTDAEVIVVSRGHQGVAVVTECEAHTVPAIPGPVVSTVGAGDAMVAGMVGGLLQGWTVLKAVRLGLACSAAMVSTPGTAMFTRADLERFSDDGPPYGLLQP